MKIKTCSLCKISAVVMYRIKIDSSKNWIFVCKTCCQQSQSLVHYKYGGTWKGASN